MDVTAKGFWLLPTFGRVSTNVPKFFAAAVAAGMTTPGYLVVDMRDYGANQAAYDDLDLPERWSVHVVPGGGCAIATDQALHELLTPDTAWVGWLADDLVPETQDWDKRAIAALDPFGLVSTNDDMYAPTKFNGATAYGGDLVRALGYITVPGTQHWYPDNLAEEIGRACGNWHCLMDVMVKHRHVSLTGNKDATSLHTNTAWVRDDRAWHEWMRTEKDAAVQRVLDCMGAHGISLSRPDFGGARVMLCTPCGDGRFESVFMRSYVETRDVLKGYNASLHLCELPYCSDIVHARNRLFGSFLRSTDDYVLWIDSDQGWEANDVVRLLMAKSDFVAAAGIRKVSPASFAVTVSDDSGRPIPVRFDSETGYLEATSVGMAFVLLSRACVEKMAAAFSSLEFVAADGRVEVGVFLPQIVNRRYMPEDYAFCWRWRQLGGRILVDPSISLAHVGQNVWKGSWLEQLEKKALEEGRAA